MAQVVTVLNDADFNGECFIYGSEGEREEVLLHRVVAFPDAIPVGIVSGTPSQSTTLKNRPICVLSTISKSFG
jgi:hypothetical protein